MTADEAVSAEKRRTTDNPAVRRGVAVLRRILEEETFDIREVEPADFRGWLDLHLTRRERDPTFRQRVLIRDLRRDKPELRAAEREHRRAARLDAASVVYPRLRRLEQELAGAEKAIAGLAAAAAKARPEKRRLLAAKLKAFRSKRRTLAAERATLVRSSAERQAFLRAERTLGRLRKATGLDVAESRLARMLTERGRRGGRAGKSFEQICTAIVEAAVLPDLVRADAAGLVRVLHGVTLGAARVELDLVVVRRPLRGDGDVEVLAVVEAKRNINDLEHGFRRRQEDLAWLTGQVSEIDPAAYRTAAFPTGRFDRRVVHHEAGEDFSFGPGSFRRLRRDTLTGLFLDRLYLITLAGQVWGLSSAALSKIGHRVATDSRWETRHEARLEGLLKGCLALARPFETPDLLRLLSEDSRRARRLLVVNR